MTYTLRIDLFKGIIYKQVSWFDNKDKAPGILSNVLSEDVNALNGLTSEHIATLLEAGLNLVVGIILSFIYTWRMALVSTAVSPLLVIGAILMSRMQNKLRSGGKTSMEEKTKDDPYKKSNALLSDIIMNYRTVISFGEKNVDYLMS